MALRVWVLGDEVVQAYFHPLNVDVEQHPIKSMFDFSRLKDVSERLRKWHVMR